MRRITALTMSALAMLAVCPSIAGAQSNPVLTGATRGIEDEHADEAQARLSIRELKAEAHIAGRMADVTLELLVASSGAMDEARLALTLPNDAVVTGYALDVEGRLIPGQLIEQPKARNVYQDEVRGRVDPGLGEVTAANVFNTRIYPVTAEHPRRIRVSFSAPFDPEKGLELPLGGPDPIGTVSISVTVEGYAAAPEIRLAGNSVAASASSSGWTAQAGGSNLRLLGGLVVRGGQISAPLQVLRHASGREFFVLSDRTGNSAPTAPRGGHMRVYWDRSLSHRDDRIDDEIEALAVLVETTAPQAIDLVTFASDRPQVTSLPNVAALREALRHITYRGGTSLAGLDSLRLGAASQCVLVFDGQVTVDHTAAFVPDCNTSILTGANGADGARLGRMAQRLRGRLVRVAQGQGREAAAELALGGNGVVFVRDAAGRRLTWRALPAAPGSVLLVGELPAGRHGGLSVRTAGSTSDRTYTIGGAAMRLDAPGALWASDEVAALGDDPARHEDMVLLAREFQVAGPQLAFLVLENPQQYLRANIVPPDGFSSEWRAQYAAAATARDEQQRGAREQRLEFAIAQWRARQEWWNSKFTPAPRNRVSGGAVSENGGGGDGDIAVSGTRISNGSAPPPPPPPPVVAPPPMPVPPPVPTGQATAAANERPDQAEQIIVTSSRNPGASAESDGGDESCDTCVVASARRSERLQTAPVAITAVTGDSSQPQPQPSTTAARNERTIALDLSNVLSNRPYLAALDSAPAAQRLSVLTEQELAYGSIPAFYLDTAEWFRLKGDAATAQALLYSALELEQSDDETRQIVSFRLERDGQLDRAVAMAERFAANASFRPQPKRFLALALAARGKARGRAGRADLERAFKLLTEVALVPPEVDFNSEYDGIEVVSLMEANALIPFIEAVGGHWELDSRLTGLLDTDARIVIEWTADDADIDLWVDEPNGERVYYGYQRSTSGGQISNDQTAGYGPEEYAIRRAPSGAYEVRINGFRADRINPNGPGRVLIRMIRNFGRRNSGEVLVDSDLAFQRGPNRNAEDGTRPVATLRVGR